MTMFVKFGMPILGWLATLAAMRFCKLDKAEMDQLGFGTRNYFSRVFQEVAGCTPVQYREERSLH